MELQMPRLGAKEVAAALGVAERTALRLMQNGDVESMRVGARLWRTTPARLGEYITRSFNARRTRPEIRILEQTIVCMRELQRLGRLSAEQQEELKALDARLESLLDRKAPQQQEHQEDQAQVA